MTQGQSAGRRLGRERTRRSAGFRRGLPLAALLLAGAVVAHGAWLRGGSMNYASATKALLLSNVSAGLPGFVNGDLMTVEAHFPVGASGTSSGPGGYVTFYVPAGTQVVGAQIIDGAGNPLAARPATSAQSGEGISKGWGPIGSLSFATGLNAWNPALLPGACTTSAKTASTCMSGLAAVYGDTGIFYSTRSDTALYTGDGSAVITLGNGYQVNPTSTLPWADLGAAGQERVHNRWDAVQSNAFGAGNGGPLANPGFSVADATPINTTGRGGTPYLAGSPVAGPDSSLPLDRAATTGPWNRISYPGSCLASSPLPATSAGGSGADPVTAANSFNACTPTSAGAALSQSAPLPSGTTAVRFAVGGITFAPVQETVHARVTLRVTNAAALTPANVEGSGGDSTQGAKAGNDNPWRYWVGAVATPQDPASLAVKKSIVAVDGVPVTGALPPIGAGATLRYRLTYANTWVSAQTAVVLKDTLPAKISAVRNFVVVSGPALLPTTPAAPAAGSTFSFASIAVLGAGQGGAVEFDAQTTGAAGDVITNTASLQSAQTAVVTSAVSYTVAATADLQLTKTGPLYARPGAAISYTLGLNNLSPSQAAAQASGVIVTDVLPAFVSYLSSSPAATVSGASGAQTLSWAVGLLPGGASQNFTVTVLLPTAAVLASSAAARTQTNTASVSSTSLDPVISNNAASATTRLVAGRLGKRVRNLTQGAAFGITSAGRPGETLEYCVDFANDGGADLPSFVITDPVPASTLAVLDGYGAGLGVQLTRGSAVTPLTSSAADTDGGALNGLLSVHLGNLLVGESGAVCFQASIR